MIAELRQEHPEASIRTRCPVAGGSRSWVAACPGSDQRDLTLRDAIEEIVLAFPGYGYRRVTHALARDGWEVKHKRVVRVMREESLLCQLKRGFVPTTDSRHGYRRSPNRIKDLVIERPDHVWSADRTYIRLPSAFSPDVAIADSGAAISGNSPDCFQLLEEDAGDCGNLDRDFRK